MKKLLAQESGKDASEVTNQEAADYFLELAVARKNSLRQDYEAFLSEVLGKPFAFAGKAEGKKAVQPQLSPVMAAAGVA
jgi:hypothetical protein